MKYFMITICLFFLIGCSINCYDNFTYEEEFESLKDAFYWVVLNIKYVSDGPDNTYDYWQPAQETYDLQTGDCEDMTIIFNGFAKDMGYEPYFIWIDNHAFAQCNGIYYDPAHRTISETRNSGPGLKLNYKQLMWIINN